jgi:hypothetical protein
MRPTALPDGRLGMLCAGGVDHGRILEVMVAYDWDSHQITPLVAGALPGAGDFTWKPDMSKGVLSTLPAYSTLYWISTVGTEPIPATLTDGRKSWRLSDTIDALEAYDRRTTSTGREPHPVGEVGQVDWSPKGDRIAFWASLEPIGRSYNPLMRIAWDLYLMDVETLQTKRVVRGVEDAHNVAWAPNGRWLAYTAPTGLWLVAPDTGESKLVHKGDFSAIAWSPDGRTVLGLRCAQAACDMPEVWRYDVSSISARVK